MKFNTPEYMERYLPSEPIGWLRKATAWTDAGQPVQDADVIRFSDTLPVYGPTPYPCADFPFPRERYHVARFPGGTRYLVNTEGANYARYIVRLPDSLGPDPDPRD